MAGLATMISRLDWPPWLDWLPWLNWFPGLWCLPWFIRFPWLDYIRRPGTADVSSFPGNRSDKGVYVRARDGVKMELGRPLPKGFHVLEDTRPPGASPCSGIGNITGIQVAPDPAGKSAFQGAIAIETRKGKGPSHYTPGAAIVTNSYRRIMFRPEDSSYQ